MHLIRGRHNLRPCHLGCAATIGNFDGVHLGHQAILKELKERAGFHGVPSLVMTFEPHPRDYFGSLPIAQRLTRFRDKVLALKRAGIDRLLILPFNRELATLSASEFIEKVLVGGIGVRDLVVGDDFRFGKGRQGDIGMLMSAGQQFGFKVKRMPTYSFQGERVSSTRIRDILGKGDLNLGTELLGHPYSVSGRVVRGDQRGRLLGFPTANIHWPARPGRPGGVVRLPVSGVYTVAVLGMGEGVLYGVANVGVRPTVDGTRQSLEVHLLDFSGNIYGRYLEVRFLDRLRDECRFDGVEALKTQIGLDVTEARRRLGEMSDAQALGSV